MRRTSLGRICLSCGSKRFRKDTNGSLICRNGHQLDEAEEVTEDGAALIGSQRKIRSKGSRHTKAESQPRPPRAEMTVPQLQEVLISQVNWFISNKKAPKEFEIIVRDLWLVWLSQISICL
jgi:hypothetical protein